MAEQRKRICTRSVEMSGDGEGLSAEAVLRSTLEELRKIREEQAVCLQRQEELATLLRQRDQELQRLRETQSPEDVA